MQDLTLPSGARMPKYGMGTWHMGERGGAHAQETTALVAGLDAGVRMIDTAEMYAHGGAEEVIAPAIKNRRDEVFIVSKVLPSNASRAGVPRACERSLQRLGTDRIDLYLLHWPGSTPIEETYAALVELRDAGKIVDLGVSNFDVSDLAQWMAIDSAALTAVNQIYYSLATREAEAAVIPWCLQRGIHIQAYTPLEASSSALLDHPTLDEIAQKHRATPAQVALAWLYRQPGVVPIPKSSNSERTIENAACIELDLNDTDLNDLHAAFPAPDATRYLPMR
ncbi:MAG: diketogulonate reductase-like aldo/keto reductase [Gammaproteobacteria bacterium]|jgi:diketogulonate reductase-like aldo/keto reductase